MNSFQIKTFFFVLLMFSLILGGEASSPFLKVKIKNVKSKMADSVETSIRRGWSKYLEEHPEVLVNPGKKYKDDQFCHISFNLTEDTESPEAELESIEPEFTELASTKPESVESKSTKPESIEPESVESKSMKPESTKSVVIKEPNIDLDSVTVLKHKNNYAYNLATIDFLRASQLRLKKEDKSKPIEIIFEYLAY